MGWPIMTWLVIPKSKGKIKTFNNVCGKIRLWDQVENEILPRKNCIDFLNSLHLNISSLNSTHLIFSVI